MQRFSSTFLTGALALATVSFGAPADAAPNGRANGVFNHWTPERIADAQPRDLVIDSRGLGYLRGADGALTPYGHDIAPMGKPGGGAEDTTPPTIEDLSPASGATIGASQVFSATVTDESGLKSVSMEVRLGGGQAQSFNMSGAGDTWSVSLSGFTDGAWEWRVVAKDRGSRGGNTGESAWVDFTVDTAGGGDGGGGDGGGDPPPDGVVVNDAWGFGGAVQTAAGRIYFEMPANKGFKRWNGYVCSGTVATDEVTGRSIIITAAHCVYDDANKAFARNVLFIPNQAGTTGSGTDTNCSNDPLGCWAPAFGVVDAEWTNRTFPDNIPWDYAYYVVDDSGAHSGTAGPTGTDVLDAEAGSLPVSFATPTPDLGHALGYSYSDDPNFMYCSEGFNNDEGVQNWWLPNCGLSGGSSGGPWSDNMDETTGVGTIISVNSWGYGDLPGMAGPRLDTSSAGCVFEDAKTGDLGLANASDGSAGIASSCP